VTGRLLRGAACLTVALIGFGCTSALKEPPPVSTLATGRTAPGVTREPIGALLQRASREMDRAPNPEAVAEAQRLYLEVAGREGAPVEAFLGAARATAWLVEHTDDGQRREELATEGVQIGQWCRRLYPTDPECTYRLALAVGQQARERPATATNGLDVMVELLTEVINQAPNLDFAGGHRVLALVYLRAPGWPTGPGDPELGLEQARAAVEAFPSYPPNQLALGEALRENGRVDEAIEALETGVRLARASTEPEAAEWTRQGGEALADIR